jgi:hypothetical protein
MSRSFTNFLLFEGILDNLPDTNPRLVAFANKLLHPRVPIIEDDCETKLGDVVKLTRDAVGKVSLFSYGTFEYDSGSGVEFTTILADDILIDDQVTGLLTTFTQISTRSMPTCTSEGGICRKCLRGSNQEDYPDLIDVPAIGTFFEVDDNITRPYLTYLAETYSGSLLGFKSFIQDKLPIREGLIRDLISDAELSSMYRELSKIGSMDAKYLAYGDTINDKLEKALFILVMYGFFSNVRI